MKHLKNILLFILSLCMISHVYGASIRIGNELKWKKVLEMNCFSADNRVGPRLIQPGDHHQFFFGTTFLGKTQFMCTLRQGPNFRHHQKFVGFKVFSRSDYGADWDWRARENGIYLKIVGGKHASREANMHKAYDWIN